MRLKKDQKELLLKWIAEGKRTDEINQLARAEEPPFDVSRGQVDFYRKTRGVRMEQIRSQAEDAAIVDGFNTAAGRIAKLARLAALLEEDLMTGLTWTHQVKGIGGKGTFERIEYEEFNASEIAQYRGLLDDIAKERGERAAKFDGTLEVDLIWDLPTPGWQPPASSSESANEPAKS